jgi:Domain of unknown function (DUF4149)
LLILATLITALLFGGMVLYSFGFAAFLFTALPPDVAGRTIRRAFPMFYLFVLGCSAAAAVVLWAGHLPGAGLLALVAGTVLPTRQILMPAINRANDTRAKGRFKALHRLSVAITLAHIALTGTVLARLAGAA